MNQERVDYIDIAKGIAIISIILGHLGNWSINSVVFTFHVTLFFVITGYFVNEKKSISEFIKYKARTLLVPYYVTSGIMICIGTIQGLIYKTGAFNEALMWLYATAYGAGDSYNSPFYIKSIGAIWFLWATFWGCLFLRLVLTLPKIIRPLIIVCLFLLGYYSRAICWFPLSIQAGACSTIFMYIGQLVFRYKDKIKELPRTLLGAGTCVALCVWISFIKNFQSFWLVHCDVGRGLIDIFGSICGCWIIILIAYIIDKKIHHLGNALAFLGRYSLLVLCIHIVELNFFPWFNLCDSLYQAGIYIIPELYVVICGKLVFDLGLTYILAKNTLVRKILGYK